MVGFGKYLRQKATYWAPASADASGKRTYGQPSVVWVRWQDGRSVNLGDDGREFVSSAEVYSGIKLEREGYLFLGTSGEIDPRGQPGARQIAQSGESPSLHATQILYKAWLL